MFRKLSLGLLIIICSSCAKNSQKSACGMQVCTALFASIGSGFFDKNNQPIAVTNFEEVNLRTNKIMTHAYPPNVDYVAGYFILADDSDLKDLSADGDMIKVTGTNPATGQTISATFKVAGGCRCHVEKLSGPDHVKFNQ